MKASTLAVLVVLSFAGACSKVDKVEKGIAGTNKKMEAVSQATAETNKNIEVMSKQLRSTSSKEIRDKAFKEIVSPDVELGSKKEAALTYFRNFEFQLWEPNVKYADVSSRDVLIEEAVEEFLLKASDITAEINLNKIDTKRPNNAEKAFLALAFAIAEVNREQLAIAAQNPKYDVISFYDIARQTFFNESNPEVRLKNHEYLMLETENKNAMVALIQSRMNYLTREAMGDLIDRGQMTLGQKFKSIFHKLTGGRFGSNEVPEIYDQANEATKVKIARNLGNALEAKNFLKEIKLSGELEEDIRKDLVNVDFNDGKIENKSTDAHKEKIRGLISNLVK